MEQLMRRSGSRAPRGYARGLTIIELLISMTISLVVLSAITYLYVGARGAYRANESLARVQEGGRFALDFIAQDLRMTSYTGCRSRSLSADAGNFYNITLPAIAFNGSGDGVLGYEDGAGWVNPTLVTTTPIAHAAGDVLTVRRAAGLQTGIVGSSDPVVRTVTLRHNAIGARNGDLVVLGDCRQAMVFRVTNNPVTTGVGNFPTVLEFGVAGNAAVITPGAADFDESSRASALRFIETTYFVGINPAGRRSLYRVSTDGIEELVDNVEDLDIVYGVDTSMPEPDDIADTYVRADALVAAPATPNWRQVVAVRISLLVVGPEESITTNAQTYALRDTNGDGLPETQTAPDRRLRQVFTTTVALRNRVL
jgi:type IV pilus assembly protein PilW